MKSLFLFILLIMMMVPISGCSQITGERDEILIDTDL